MEVVLFKCIKFQARLSTKGCMANQAAAVEAIKCLTTGEPARRWCVDRLFKCGECERGTKVKGGPAAINMILRDAEETAKRLDAAVYQPLFAEGERETQMDRRARWRLLNREKIRRYARNRRAQHAATAT